MLAAIVTLVRYAYTFLCDIRQAQNVFNSEIVIVFFPFFFSHSFPFFCARRHLIPFQVEHKSKLLVGSTLDIDSFKSTRDSLTAIVSKCVPPLQLVLCIYHSRRAGEEM